MGDGMNISTCLAKPQLKLNGKLHICIPFWVVGQVQVHLFIFTPQTKCRTKIILFLCSKSLTLAVQIRLIRKELDLVNSRIRI